MYLKLNLKLISTDDDVAHAATGQALVKSQAALANGTVALLVAGGQRREHNAVLELKVANRNGLEQLSGRCGHGHSSLVGAAAMLPRSCLEDMAWRYSGTKKIGEYQVAAGGWSGRPVGLSQSVTVRPYFAEQLLQIETNQSSLPKDLDL